MKAVSNTIWSAAELAKALGVSVPGDWVAQGLSMDSRTVRQGDVFLALKGDRLDGHAYVADALQKGAVAAIVSDHVEACNADQLIVVPDTMEALQALGRAARARCAGTMIGVTGSVGKTGTKEMLAAAFDAEGQVHASAKSFNNHWGVPFSLASMHAGTDFGIFEMGMNHANEIRPLTQMVRPHIALITTVAPVHAEHFENGLEGIAAAKAEIFEGLESGGKAVLPRDNEMYDVLIETARQCEADIYTFGEHAESDACMTECLVAANGSRVKAVILGEDITYNLQMAGKHLALNALAVLLVVKLSGGDIHRAAKALSQITPLAGRGKQEYLDLGDKDNPVVLIDESYNASPVAMRAAFKVLALIDPGRGGRRIAVLGDMYETGADAEQQHKDLALPLEAAGVQLVYTSGPLMRKLQESLPQDKRGAHADDSAELAKIVPDVLVPGDVVLVKGSRGGGEKPRMQLVVEALRALPDRLKGKKT